MKLFYVALLLLGLFFLFTCSLELGKKPCTKKETCNLPGYQCVGSFCIKKTIAERERAADGPGEPPKVPPEKTREQSISQEELPPQPDKQMIRVMRRLIVLSIADPGMPLFLMLFCSPWLLKGTSLQ